MARTVTIVDKGWNKIKTEMRQLERASVKVGLRAGGPSQKDVPVVVYGAWNEFGTENIPARPWMRHTADTKQGKLAKRANVVMRQLLGGQFGVDGVLESFGLFWQRELRNTIRESPSWAAPNAPSTIRSKGSAVPLVNHNVLRNAIDFEKVR